MCNHILTYLILQHDVVGWLNCTWMFMDFINDMEDELIDQIYAYGYFINYNYFIKIRDGIVSIHVVSLLKFIFI